MFQLELDFGVELYNRRTSAIAEKTCIFQECDKPPVIEQQRCRRHLLSVYISRNGKNLYIENTSMCEALLEQE